MVDGKLVVGLAYLVMLAIIASEKIDRVIVAVATLVFVIVTSIVLGYADPVQAARAVDLDVIGLVVVASIASWMIEDSGLAKRIADILSRTSRGDPKRFLLAASIISGFLSLYMENVTVVILLAPIVFRVSRELGVNPAPILVAVALSSNLSGSALLVGDPQAAIVASAYRLSFMDFIVYAGRPSMFFIVVAGMLAAIASLPLYVKSLRARSHHAGQVVVGQVAQSTPMTSYEKAVIAGIGGKILMLAIKNELGLSLTQAAAPPILLVAALFVRGRERVLSLLKAALDIKLIAFLASLFYLVGFIDEVSLTKDIAHAILVVTESPVETAALLIVVSALASSIIDNVPFIAAMIPVINYVSEEYMIDPVVLSWALLLGATMGGGLTYIGAMPNYTAVRILEREGHRITFKDFVKIGVPYTVVALSAGAAVYYTFYLPILLPPHT